MGFALVLLFWAVLIGMYFFLYNANKWLFYILLLVWAFIWALVFKGIKRKLLFFSALLLLLLLYGVLHFSPVQTWLVKKVSANLSEKLHTKVTVDNVDFRFFNKLLIKGVMVEDLKKDTLLYAGIISGTANDWFIFKEKITIENIGLENAIVNMNRRDSVWNYQFLINYFSSTDTTKKGTSNKTDIDLKELHLTNVKFNKIDQWIGQNMVANIGKLDLKMELFDLKSKKIHIKEILLDKPLFAQSDYDGNRPPRNNLQQVIEKIPVIGAFKWNQSGWQIQMDNLELKDAVFRNDKNNALPFTDRFDGQHLFFSSLNGSMKNLLFLHDTLKVKISLSAKERSGLIIKKLESNMKLTPVLMEFNNLDLQTNNSRLRDYYAMDYTNFNEDFSSFLHNVSLHAKFKESNINSDDLALFAPALKNWKRIFYLEGKADGPIDNFSAKEMKIRTGNTYLEGNIALRGLPDINTTFIDFQSKALHTNYKDLVSIAPQIKNIDKPSIPKLGSIDFKGNFTGFIRDFVAYGTFNTALGNITADVNMKTPIGQPAKYSGTISSTGFNIGSFINSTSLGSIALDVKIDGTGFALNELKEKVAGKISFIKVGNYTYKNLTINGDFEKQLFIGHASIDDPNLKISSLDGAINFMEKSPGFKLQANVEKADLKSLGLVKDTFLFSGDLDLNFTGNNIDNFLGNAKVTNAKLLQGNNKLSFDFLNINSEIINGNKSLSLNTNEIDANVTGNFKIMELPDAVTVLLAKYYPSYIKAPSYIVKSTQDFSFSIQTKKVDEYIKIFDKKLSGFNNSTVNGHFNLQNYDLQLNASIPQFTYDGKIINNITLLARGNKDTLMTDIAIEDITIQDSLHLPFTKLKIATNNDLSVIKLNTSASKIFGDAELNASIQTMNDGVKIHFYPSSFIINKKKWQLEKDGELVLRKKFIDASEVKFYSGNQEIILFTEQSQINNSTDLIAKLKNIDIEDFAFVLPKKPSLKGMLTGNLTIKDLLGKPSINFKGFADSTHVDGNNIGKINIDANVNTNSGAFDYKGNVDEKDNKFDISGKGNFKDTLGNSFETYVKIERFDLAFLKPYLKTVFSDVQGTANGEIQLIQTNKALSIIGNPTITNGSFKVGYTQVRYNFDKQALRFGKDLIDIGTLQIKDTLGNTGTVSGKIYHQFFDNFSFEKLRFSTPKMLLLNTTKKDNQQFYGTVIGRANMTLDGDIANMKMNIEGEPSLTDSSHVYLPTGDSKESNVIDYIDFIQFGSLMDKDISSKAVTNLLIELDLTANPACKIDVILDEATGDIIKGQGNGKLNIKVRTNEALSMRGRYEITKGEYTFNFQSLLRRPFTLNSGSITWSGDPLLAVIDMNAEYLVKNVDISSFTSLSNTQRLQEDITVLSHLTGTLKKPDIDFEFRLPEKSPFAKDFLVLKRLADYKTDETEMNKQVASLLLFNQFISANQSFFSGGSIPSIATGTIGGIVSAWLTSILNKTLEKATRGVVSFVVDLNPSLNTQQANQLQANIRSSLQFKLRKNIRLLVGGNLDYNNAIAQLYNTGNKITPDFTLEWLINKDGSLVGTLYNRTSVDLTSGQRNRSAIQLGYRKEVDRFWDIFRSKKRIKQLEALRNKGKSTKG